MSMSVRSIAAAGLALAAMVSAAGAQSVTMNTGAYSYGQGGEFNATPSGFPYVPARLGLTPYFETFCLERSEQFSPGSTYSVTIDTYASGGGGGAIAGQDPLDDRSAYLYSLFINGTLPGYDYSNMLGLRQANAGALQNVFWYIEEEVATLDTPEAVAYYAISAGGIGQGIDGVRVMNLFTQDQAGAITLNQSMLVKFNDIPAPAGASVLGLAAVGALRRRR